MGGFCPGYYTAYVTDNITSCQTYVDVYFYGDSTSNFGLTAYVYPSAPSEDGLCDGTAYVDVYGGTAPYTFMHSDGNTGQYVTGLCSGIYSVYVTDDTGDTLLINYIVPEPSYIFNGGMYGDSSIVDTMYNDLIEDCLIDYTTLDTAFVSGLEYIALDSLMVTWSVIDANGTIQLYQSYSISTGAGVYELILQVFCPQRSGVPYVYATDQVYFNPATMAVEQISKTGTTLKAYPNPVQDILTIVQEEALPSVITMYDITGKVVHVEFSSQKETKIDLAHLAKGQYTLHVSNEKTQETQLIIK